MRSKRCSSLLPISERCCSLSSVAEITSTSTFFSCSCFSTAKCS
ncbi:Uncharacterised protein [Vibrio cholerae]|nr:Uncharacterised protein [Vibrio cholerae]